METLTPADGTFTPLNQALKVEPEWLIPNLMPVGLGFMGGPPKCQKSTFTMAVAAIVAEYQCAALPEEFQKVVRPGPVMVFSSEATAGELRHMVEVGLGVAPLRDDESILVADDPWAFMLDTGDGQRQLLHWLGERAPRLVIIDPLRNFHTLEEKDSGEMYQMLKPLRQWAVTNKAAVILVHHTKKLDEARDYGALDMRGTSALFGMADFVLMLSPQKNGSTNVDAVFKRGESWKKNITLKSYGKKEVEEEFSVFERQVHRCFALGASNLDEVCASVHASKTRVAAAVEKLLKRKMMKRDGRKFLALPMKRAVEAA